MRYTTQLSDLQKANLEEMSLCFDSRTYVNDNGGNISAPLVTILDSWENFKSISPIFNTSNYERHPLYMDYIVALLYSGGKHVDFLRPCIDQKHKNGIPKASKSGKLYKTRYEVIDISEDLENSSDSTSASDGSHNRELFNTLELCLQNGFHHAASGLLFAYAIMANNEIDKRVPQLRICLASIDKAHGTNTYNSDMSDDEVLDLIKDNFGDYASHVKYFTERKISLHFIKDTMLSHILRFTSTSEFLITYLLTTNEGSADNKFFKEFLAKTLTTELIEHIEKYNHYIPNFDNPNALPFAHLQVCRHLGYYGKNFDTTYVLEAAKFFNYPLPEYAKTEQEKKIVAKAMAEYNPITYSNWEAKTISSRVITLLNTISRCYSDFAGLWAQHQYATINLRKFKFNSPVFEFPEKYPDYYKYFICEKGISTAEHITKIKHDWQLINNEYKKIIWEMDLQFSLKDPFLLGNKITRITHNTPMYNFSDTNTINHANVITSQDDFFTKDYTNEDNKLLHRDYFPFSNFATQYSSKKQDETSYTKMKATQVIGLNTAMNFGQLFISNILKLQEEERYKSITANMSSSIVFSNKELSNLVQNTLWSDFTFEEIKEYQANAMKYNDALSNSVNFAAVDQKLLHVNRTQAKQNLELNKKLLMSTFAALASSIVPNSVLATTNVLVSFYLHNKETRKQKMIKDSGLEAKSLEIAAFLSNLIALKEKKFELSDIEKSVLVDYLSVVMATMLTSCRTLKVIKYLAESTYEIKDNKNDPSVKNIQYVLKFCDLFLKVAKSPAIIKDLRNNLDPNKFKITDDCKLLQLLNDCNIDPKLLLGIAPKKYVNPADIVVFKYRPSTRTKLYKKIRGSNFLKFGSI